MERKYELDYVKPACKLAGINGNAFVVMGAVKQALKKAGINKKIIEQYEAEATAGDYDNLLRVSMEYVASY